MTIADLKRLSIGRLKDVNQFKDVFDFSDCVYDAIQELQRDTLCSKMRARKYVATNGEIGSIAVTNGGSGYTSPPTISFSGGGGTGAAATAVITAGIVTSIIVINPGKGYTSNPTLTFNPASTTAATPTISTQTYWTIINPVFTGVNSGSLGIECLFIDAMWIISSNGKLTPVHLIGEWDIQNEKDYGLLYSDTTQYNASLTFNADNIEIKAPWDMTGKTLEVWLRFQTPYIQDENAVTVTNTPDLYLETIPKQFQPRLVSGVKCHAYEALEEITGGTGRYANLVQLFSQRWFGRDIPFVKQEVNATKATETVHVIRASGVFTEDTSRNL